MSNRNEPLAPEGGHRRLVDLLPPKLGVILDIGAGQGPEDLLPARDLFQPPRIQAIGGQLHVCRCCGHLYWEGSHVRRIRRRLESFAHIGDDDDVD